MPYQFTCEHCDTPFSRVDKPTPKRPYRFCSNACRGAALKAPIANRFWSKVSVRGADECWPWMTALNEHGYGVFNVDGRIERAQRVAYYLTYGYWPENGLHRCDNPPCCNPAHVFDGTKADNMTDMVAKGRESRPWAKLTEAEVKDIRTRVRNGETQRTLALAYGLNGSTVSEIVNRKTYKHIE